MTDPWSPEYTLEEQEAEKLISAQFSEISLSQIKVLGKGFDNTVFMVNNEYVFRFPRRKVAVELLETENRLLPQLYPRLPLEIPEPIFRGEPGNGYPWPFLGYKIVKGCIPGTLTHEQRIKSAVEMAGFLKVLHTYPVSSARTCLVPPDRLHRLNIEKRKMRLVENIEKAKALELLPSADEFALYAKTIQHIEVSPVQKLVHGDLHFRNIVIDPQGKICGVIDWGDTHIGHPAVDLSFVYSFFPAEGRRIFFGIYGQIDEETEQLARFKAIYTLLFLLLYGADQQHPEVVAGAQEGLLLAMN
ncbi:MAG: phosphotransferase, partial [Bacillota bacterium]|nr:phosphotransferase [Bacillota bacterium]